MKTVLDLMGIGSWRSEHGLTYLQPAQPEDMPERVLVQRFERNGIGERRLAEQWYYTKSERVVL